MSKGLEFRAVAVMACDDDVVPLQARIAAVTDERDLEEVYDTERHLLVCGTPSRRTVRAERKIRVSVLVIDDCHEGEHHARSVV